MHVDWRINNHPSVEKSSIKISSEAKIMLVDIKYKTKAGITMNLEETEALLPFIGFHIMYIMSIRKIDFIEGEYYHIYNRGNSKQKIFLDEKDRERFLKLLYLCNSRQRIDFSNDIVKRKINVWDFKRGESIVKIGAWVLMPNHFHLYITPKTEARLPFSNAVTDFMHRLLTAYSKYFNAKYQRTGSLFEGKFKSVHIENDIQAKYLFSYIHLNPIKLIDSKWKEKGIKDKKKAINFLNSYKWSSYLDYLEIIRSENKIISRADFLDYFDSKKSFREEIFDWIEIKSKKD